MRETTNEKQLFHLTFEVLIPSIFHPDSLGSFAFSRLKIIKNERVG
jgi:hypothetical protein